MPTARLVIEEVGPANQLLWFNSRNLKGGPMAKKEQSDETAADQEQVQQDDQLRIRWDGSNMRSAYSNVCNVAGGREEIVLLFGMNQAWHAGQKEVTVQLTDRVILSPFAAKRLSNLLNNVLQDYERKYGTLEQEAAMPQTDTPTVQ